MELARYLLISTACLSISFITYRLFLGKVYHFQYLRAFLTFSILLSLLLPLSAIRVDYSLLFNLRPEAAGSNTITVPYNNIVLTSSTEEGFFASHYILFTRIYFAIVIFMGIRILFQLFRITRLFLQSEKKKKGKNILLISSSVKSPFSFFRLIFLPEDISDKDEADSIIAHENIHASQYHSFDNLLVELVSAVMWFNPLVWRMKSSLHMVHEYLADEGALDTGIDRLRYQTLLLNHVSEERLVCLSSGLNHSLIKKRMIMMTKSKNNRGKKLKILTLLPLSAMLIMAVALINGIFPQQVKAEKPSVSSFISPVNAIEKSVVNPQDTVKKMIIVVKTKVDKKNEKGDNCNEEKKVVVLTGDNITTSFDGDSVMHVIEVKDKGSLEGLDSENIETVTVQGNDTVIVKCKEVKKSGKNKIIIRNNDKSKSDKLLILLDGKKISKEEMDKIDPATIATVNVMKGEGAKKQGYKGKYEGVIEITTQAKK